MATLLKNQILKHLSKFTKNLSADKINISTLKGEGELTDLELNEDVLTELLELPTWLKITKAVCTRVAIRIQWTKLKSQPIRMVLDEVIVEVKICERPRQSNSQVLLHLSSGKYGFVDRVMDGIYVHVSSVIVKLISQKFLASLQLSKVRVESVSPTWHITKDLRSTRIKDKKRGQILLFKEVEWQTTHIEINGVEAEKVISAPLRLIANQSKIRICIKKSLSDRSIVASRLTMLLDDLLWVLTLAQVKAAMLYASSLKDVIERSAEQSKRLAADLLKMETTKNSNTDSKQQKQQSVSHKQESAADKYFSQFDVPNTSYHLITSKFDLHLCDDDSPVLDEKRHWKIKGGSIQITFYKLAFNFYPFNIAGSERKSWYRYTDSFGSREAWVKKLFNEFRNNAVKLRKICESTPVASSVPASSAARGGELQGKAISSNQSVSSVKGGSMNEHSKNVMASKSSLASLLQQNSTPKSTRLLESVLVIKVEDMTVGTVSVPGGQKQQGRSKFFCSDKQELLLPKDTCVVHVEYTDYFFPEGLDYPVPDANFYMLVNPVRVTMDMLTLLWASAFLLPLAETLESAFRDEGVIEHMDVKVDMLMPRVIFPAEKMVDHQHPCYPDAVQLQVSKLIVTNQRTEEKMTREDLQSVLVDYVDAKLFFNSSGSGFPNDEGCLQGIPELMKEHAAGRDNPYIDKNVKILLEQTDSQGRLPAFNHTQSQTTKPLTHHLNCNSLKRSAISDVWSASVEQVWVEFLVRNQPVSCVEAIPASVWMCVTQNSDTEQGNMLNKDTGLQAEVFPENGKHDHDEMDFKVHVLAKPFGKIRIQLNHYQYLFVLSFLESFSAFIADFTAYQLSMSSIPKSTLLNATTSKILSPIIIIPLVLEEVELALVQSCEVEQQIFTDSKAAWPGSNLDAASVCEIDGGEVSNLQSAVSNLQSADNNKVVSRGSHPKDVKKSYSNLADTLKSKTESLDGSFEADDDTGSSFTDASDDDFELMSMDDFEEAPAFSNNSSQSDAASFRDNNSELWNMENFTNNSAERNKMVNVVLFKLYHIEVLLEIAGDKILAKAQLARLGCIQQNNISHEDFQETFSTKGFVYVNTTEPQPLHYPIKLKLELSSFDGASDLASDTSHMTVCVSDFSLRFKISGLAFLLNFLAAEGCVLEFVPMVCEVTNLSLSLEEDESSVSVSPISIIIKQIYVARDRHGTVCISDSPSSKPFAPAAHRHTSTVTPNTVPDGLKALLTASQSGVVSLQHQLKQAHLTARNDKHQVAHLKDGPDKEDGQRNDAESKEVFENLPYDHESVLGKSDSNNPSSTSKPATLNDQSVPCDIHPVIKELENENLCLHQRLMRLEDDLLAVSKEKESLLQTLQILQGELLMPEQVRGSNISDLSMELSHDTAMPF